MRARLWVALDPSVWCLLFRIGQWPSDYLIYLRSKTEVYARRFRNSGLGVCSIRRHIKEFARVLSLWARVLCSLWLLHSRSANSSADLGPKFGGTDAKKGGHQPAISPYSYYMALASAWGGRELRCGRGALQRALMAVHLVLQDQSGEATPGPRRAGHLERRPRLGWRL